MTTKYEGGGKSREAIFDVWSRCSNGGEDETLYNLVSKGEVSRNWKVQDYIYTYVEEEGGLWENTFVELLLWVI